MKTLPAGFEAAHRPGLLVEIGYSPVLRLSSRSAVTWGGHTWAAADVQVQGLQVQPFSVAGTLVLGNMAGTVGAQALAQGVQDRLIVIYAFDGAAPTSPAWLCTAVGASAQVSSRDVRIALRHRGEFTSSPRTFVNQPAGFTNLLPAGTVLRINGIDIRLDRRS